MRELAERRKQTSERLQQIRNGLTDTEALANNKACVYATGSFGRCEASKFSDLDVFIVGKNRPDGKEGSALAQLDAICIQGDLIRLARQMGFPPFSGDGKYLTHHAVGDLTDTLGTPEDDATNTFTARLLLLLESCPLVGEKVHTEIKEEVIDAYWRDYDDHQAEFMPAYLANDILRLWRTFCVNYEARTKTTPERQKAKRKLTNYKLKHSRLLTCYSALLYLLAVYEHKKSVDRSDALTMVKLTPTERLEWLCEQSFLNAAKQTIDQLLEQYAVFLETTNSNEDDLIERFMDKERSREYMTAAYRFGDLMFEALMAIGQRDRFHRLLLV